MTEMALVHDDGPAIAGIVDDAEASVIPLSDPDITAAELAAVEEVLWSSRLSSGPVAEAFEGAFAAYLGRNYAVAVPSGTMGMLLALAS